MTPENALGSRARVPDRLLLKQHNHGTWAPRPWTGARDNPSVVSAISAMIRVICAGRTLGV